MPLLDVENCGIALAKLRQERGTTATAVAQKLGFDKSTMSKFEAGTREVKLSEYVAYMEALGLLPGDYLPRTTGVPQPVREAVAILEGRPSNEIRKAVNVIAAMFDAPSNVVDFPKQGRTEPRVTEEFPVEPEEFIEGDFDYPLELHALEVEEFEVAAGDTGVNPEVDMAAYTIHAKDVRDATHRVIKVKGDSMSPDYEEGWKLLVDTKKKRPAIGDPVAVYIKDEGSVLGYWSPSNGSVELEKANADYRPVKLGDPTTWHLIGTVQKIVDAPARKRRRR